MDQAQKLDIRRVLPMGKGLPTFPDLPGRGSARVGRLLRGAGGPRRPRMGVLVLSSAAEGQYWDVGKELLKRLEEGCPAARSCLAIRAGLESVDGRPASQATRTPEHLRTDLVVTLGASAARRVAPATQTQRILFGLVTRDIALGFLNRTDSSAKPLIRSSAVFLDHPPGRQLRLIRIALPERHRVGILVGPGRAGNLADWREAAREQGFELVLREVSAAERIGVVLDELLDRIDVLLLLPDPGVVNSGNVVGVLLASYAKRVPVVGYTRALVDAGALLGIFSDTAGLAADLADEVTRLAKEPGALLSEPHYSRRFRVGTNPAVARSLGIRIPATTALKAELEEAER